LAANGFFEFFPLPACIGLFGLSPHSVFFIVSEYYKWLFFFLHPLSQAIVVSFPTAPHSSPSLLFLLVLGFRGTVFFDRSFIPLPTSSFAFLCPSTCQGAFLSPAYDFVRFIPDITSVRLSPPLLLCCCFRYVYPLVFVTNFPNPFHISRFLTQLVTCARIFSQ